MKNLTKTLCFLLLCTMIFLGLNHIYRIPCEPGTHMEETIQRYNNLYKDPPNTWDGVILGTSITDRAWVAPMAWADYGMTIFPLSTDSQPIILSTDILDEVFKRQNIRLVVLELHGILPGAMNPGEVRVRRVTDNFHSTAARISAVDHVLSFGETAYGEDFAMKDANVWDFYFPFIKYHSRTDLTAADLTSPVNEVKGAVVAKNLAFRSRPQKTPQPSSQCAELSKIQTDFLDSFIAYAQKHDLEILFLSLPSGHNISDQKIVNAALDYAAKKGYPTLNMNTEEIYHEIRLDFSKDFYNKKHMNSYGAVKTTAYLSRYIAETFSLEDKRGQTAYEDWDLAYKTYTRLFRAGWAASSGS